MAGKKIIKNAPDGFDNSLLTYKPVYRQAPMDMKYHYYDDGVLKIRPEVGKFVTSVEELREYAESCKGCMVAVDTETTGLTYDKDFIVGFSVAKDAYHGIYVPIRHQIKRIDKIEDVKRDEDGNILYTKAGKPRKETRKETTIFENPANLPDKECLDILYEIMLNAKLVLMHNSEFDLTMIRQEGYDVLKCHTFDTTILTYLYDSENKGWNKLKEASKIVLGRHPMKFAEALGDEENFRFVDLTVGAPYGASDSACTYGLFQKLYPEVKKLICKAPQRIVMSGEKTPYDVMSKDNELIRAFTDYYNRVDLYVDRQEAVRYKEAVEKALEETDSKIYAHFNRGIFNLSTSSKEFKTAMYESKIETGLKTDKGATSYSKKGITEMERSLMSLKDILENFKTVVYEDGKLLKLKSPNTLRLSRIVSIYGQEQFQISENNNSMSLRTIEGIKCTRKEFFEELKLMYRTVKRNMEVLQLIQRHSSLMKALNSYIAKLTETDICHMRYRLQGTASGRLSSGNGSKTDKRKNHYFIDLNAQNLTKPNPAFYKAEESNEEGNILGWKFIQVSDEYYHENKDKELIVEGANPKNNIRKCLIAPKGRYIMSLDYSAQEYLVLAILSRDSKMIENFKNGVDPHTATAYGIWGEEHYDKAKRKKAKVVNFLENYMGSAFTLSKNLNIPLEEAQKIDNNYKNHFFECVQWKENSIKQCIQKQDGVCYSIFGRPRQFKTRLMTSADLAVLGTQGGTPGCPAKTYEKKANAVMAAVHRRIVNHLIQSTCGDICRWDLIRLYRKFFKKRNPDIDFYTTVHDEINYTVVKDKLVEYARMVDDIMTIYDFRKDLPIKTSIDVGYTLGTLFPFEWADKERTKLVPKRA